VTDPTPNTRPHLRRTRTDRGFAHLPPIVDDTPDPNERTEVRVYESSSAEGPHVWLALRGPNYWHQLSEGEARVAANLTTDAAWHVAEQLITLVRAHYQGGSPPVDAAYVVTELGPDHPTHWLEVAAAQLQRRNHGDEVTWAELPEQHRQHWRDCAFEVVHTFLFSDVAGENDEDDQ